MGSTTSQPSVAVQPPLPPKVDSELPKPKNDFNMYSKLNSINQIVIYAVYGLKQEPLIISKNIDEIIDQYKCYIEITVKQNPLVLYIELFQCDLKDSKGLGKILFCRIIQRLYNMIGKPKDRHFFHKLDMLDENTPVMLTAVAAVSQKPKDTLLLDQIKLEDDYIETYGFKHSDKDRKGKVRRIYFQSEDKVDEQINTIMHTTLGTIYKKCYTGGGKRKRTLKKNLLDKI